MKKTHFPAVTVIAGLLLLSPFTTLAADPPVPVEVYRAIRDYLVAPAGEDEAALKKASSLMRGDLELATRALQTLPPLTRAKPGTIHGIEFKSGGREFTYSVRLPKGYDGRKRYPVLVLPDHGSVSPEAGIGFWEAGKEDVEEYVLFRPEIVVHKDDREIFPDGQFFAIDQAIAEVMGDAMAHLRVHYAVDPERFAMTGLSQAGYYTWYYAVSFPDDFAAIAPESAGGMAVRAAIVPLAANLDGMKVRILHAEGDEITPYADAETMRDALAAAGGSVELITYTDADYPGEPFPKRHPGPHHLRLENVLPWAREQVRAVPESVTRVVRYGQQGFEGRWRVAPPQEFTGAFTLTCKNEDGALSADRPGVTYLVSPEDVLAATEFRVGGKEIRPIGDIEFMLRAFKANSDRGCLVAAHIEVTP